MKKEITSPKILLVDLETAPNLGYIWGMWEQNVLGYVTEKYLLSFAYKWLGEKTTAVRALPDYKGYTPGSENDKALCQDLWKLFDEADMIIGHNADAFDIKTANARFIYHSIWPPQTYRTVDTLKVARKHFKFNSNKLDDLGNYLGVGRKVKHTGFSLWLGCLSGDSKAWSNMRKYNKQDVVLLESVYLRLRPWVENHVNLNVIAGTEGKCSKCLNSTLIKRGYRYTNLSKAQRYECSKCGGYSTGKYLKM